MANQAIARLLGANQLPNPAPNQVGYNPYATGNRYYDGGRNAPNVGNVSGQGLLGYSQRDQAAKARKNAIMKRLQSQLTGNPLNPNYLQNNYMGVS